MDGVGASTVPQEEILQKRNTVLKLDLDSVFVPHQHHPSLTTSRFEEEFALQFGNEEINNKPISPTNKEDHTSKTQTIPVQKPKKLIKATKAHGIAGSPLFKFFNSHCTTEEDSDEESNDSKEQTNTAHNILVQNTYFAPRQQIEEAESTIQRSPRNVVGATSPGASTSPRNVSSPRNVPASSPRNVSASSSPREVSLIKREDSANSKLSKLTKLGRGIGSPEVVASSPSSSPSDSFLSDTTRSRSQSVGSSAASDTRAIKYKVKSILMDNERRINFKQLCDKEFSSENYKMFFHVQQSLKMLEQQTLLIDKMNDMIKDELNLESEQRNRLQQLLTNAENDFCRFESTLRNLEEMTLTNMGDTYLRFCSQGLNNSSTRGLSPRNEESAMLQQSYSSSSLIKKSEPTQHSTITTTTTTTTISSANVSPRTVVQADSSSKGIIKKSPSAGSSSLLQDSSPRSDSNNNNNNNSENSNSNSSHQIGKEQHNQQVNTSPRTTNEIQKGTNTSDSKDGQNVEAQSNFPFVVVVI